MSGRRFLTLEEAQLIAEAAEAWLRLRDIQMNAGEHAAAVLSVAQLRDSGCGRVDVASLGSTLLLEVAGEPAPVPITLVRPSEEDLSRGRVSVLSDLGLECIGQVRGSRIRVPHGTARLVDIRAAAAGDVGPVEREHAGA